MFHTQLSNNKLGFVNKCIDLPIQKQTNVFSSLCFTHKPICYHLLRKQMYTLLSVLGALSCVSFMFRTETNVDATS